MNLDAATVVRRDALVGMGDVGRDVVADFVEGERQADRDRNACGAAQRGGDRGRAGNRVDARRIGGVDGHAARDDAVGGRIGTVAVDVGLDEGRDLVLGIDAGAAHRDAGGPAQRQCRRGSDDDGVDARTVVRAEAQRARGKHARVRQVGLCLRGRLGHADVRPRAVVAVVLHAEVDLLVAGRVRVAVDQVVADVAINVARHRAAADAHRIVLVQSEDRFLVRHVGGVHRIAVRVPADEVARHGDADGRPDAGGAARRDRQGCRDDLRVDRTGEDGAQVERAGAVDIAVLGERVGLAQDDVGRFRARAGHTDARAAAADGHCQGGGGGDGIDLCALVGLDRDAARVGNEVGDVGDRSLDDVVDPVLRQRHSNGNRRANFATEGRRDRRRSGSCVDGRGVGRAQRNAARMDAAGSVVAERRLDLGGDLVLGEHARASDRETVLAGCGHRHRAGGDDRVDVLVRERRHRQRPFC